MAATIANLKRIGTADVLGGHAMEVFYYAGPTLYVPGVAGGDQIDCVGGNVAHQSSLRSILTVFPAVTVSGLYNLIPQPATVTKTGAPTRVFMRWIVISTGVEAAAIDLHGEFAVLTILGD